MRLRAPLIFAFVALAWAPNAAAYPPFDSTDASVAEAGKLELELGPIGYLVEGPYRWAVRPVAEVFVDREFHTFWVISGLVGAIWRTGDDLSLDLGLRTARLNGEFVGELRAGLTWAFGLR